MLNAKLLNNTLGSEVENVGYTVIPGFLTSTEIIAISEKLEEFDIDSTKKNIWFSNVDLPFNESQIFSDFLSDIIRPKLDRYFDDYLVVMFTALSKHPRSTYLYPHRDGSITDEKKYGYWNVWIPLTDTNRDNGTLFVVPKSQGYLSGVNIIQENLINERIAPKMVPLCKEVNAIAGDAWIYTDRTYHGSYANDSLNPRRCIHFGIMHKNTVFLVYRKIGENRYERYRIDPLDLIAGKLQENFIPENFYDEYEETYLSESEIESQIEQLRQLISA